MNVEKIIMPVSGIITWSILRHICNKPAFSFLRPDTLTKLTSFNFMYRNTEAKIPKKITGKTEIKKLKFLSIAIRKLKLKYFF